MKKINILEFTDAFYPSVDGVVGVVKNYSDKLNEMGKCVVACPKAKKKFHFEDNYSFDVVRCQSLGAPENNRMAIPSLDHKFKKYLKHSDYDIYHAHSPFGMGKIAIKFGKKKKIPVVLTLHTQYDRDFKRVSKNKFLNRFAMKYIMNSYNKADVVWTVSNASKQVLRNYGYKGEIDVVRNGTDFVYPENAEQLKNIVIEKHNLDTTNPIFVFVGRMAFYKNIKLIADACKILKDNNQKFTCLFVGGGFDFNEFKNYIEKIGISDRIILTGNVTDRSLIQGYFLVSDALCFPSTFDMASITKVEASAHKIPSIVVDGSCSAEEIIDKENGFLCEESAESVANVMQFIMENRELAKKCGENAYKTIYRTWDDLAKEVYEKYQQIIENYKNKNK